MPKRNPGHYIGATENGEDYQDPNCKVIWYGGRHHQCGTPPLAWTPGKNGGWQIPQEAAIWLATPAPSYTWNKDEMVGQSKEGPEEVGHG